MLRQFGQYSKALLTVFFRWWWAAVTGLIAVLGFFVTPDSGLTFGRLALVIMLFVSSALLFLVLSLVVVSWRWFLEAEANPEIVCIVPEQTGRTPLTFVVACPLRPMSPGALLGLFRNTEHDVEVCAAVLEVQGERRDRRGYQATPKWISPFHKTALQKGDVPVRDLSVCVVKSEIVRFVENSVREEFNA